MVMKFNLRWKIKFLLNNGFRPGSFEMNVAEWLYDMQEKYK